jgi:hypothetical protein
MPFCAHERLLLFSGTLRIISPQIISIQHIESLMADVNILYDFATTSSFPPLQALTSIVRRS